MDDVENKRRLAQLRFEPLPVSRLTCTIGYIVLSEEAMKNERIEM